MSARDMFRMHHAAFRRRLNAGARIALPACGEISAPQRAAFEVVQASGREPAPAFRHALHYPWNYGPRARVQA